MNTGVDGSYLGAMPKARPVLDQSVSLTPILARLFCFEKAKNECAELGLGLAVRVLATLVRWQAAQKKRALLELISVLHTVGLSPRHL